MIWIIAKFANLDIRDNCLVDLDLHAVTWAELRTEVLYVNLGSRGVALNVFTAFVDQTAA